MSKGIEISITQKKELYFSRRNSKNPKLKEHYKLYCKLLSKVIKEAKILQYKKHILTTYNKARTTWNIVKSKTGKEEISLLNIKGKLIQNQQTTANSFNDHFSSIAEKLMGANQTDKMNQLKNGAPLHYILQNCRYTYPNIKFRYISTEEIEKIIKSLKTKNAHRYDEISIKILKWSAPLISSPQTNIFNKSLELGSFRSRLKYSTVIPILKLETDSICLTSDQYLYYYPFPKFLRRLYIQELTHMLL